MTIKKALTMSLILFLAACDGQSTATSSLSTFTSNAVTEVVSRQTPTLQSTTTPVINLSSPTATIPSSTQTALSLIDRYWQACEGAIHPSLHDMALSKNNEWLAVECDPNFDNRTYTKVFKLDGSQSWDIPFYETAGMNLKSGSFPEGIESGVMKPFHWSKDGNYLYLAPRILNLDGPWLEFVDGFGLYRLDLKTGRVTATLDANAYSFSPNDRYIAYISKNGNLETWDLFTGEKNIRSVSSGSIGMGMIKWSTDSKKFTFVRALDVLWSENGQFTLYLYDFTSNNLSILLTKILEVVLLRNGFQR